MTPRKLILVVVVLIITVGTGLFARSWMISQRKPVLVAEEVLPVEPEGTFVLVARTDVPTGVFVKEGHLRWQAWPDEDVPEAYLLKESYEITDFHGSVVRRGLSAGEPVVLTRLIQPGDRGYLAAVLRPGYRAMSIRVNATSGIGGLVFPGDRVDLILTHTIKSEAGDENNGRRASETILVDVRVLAIDQYIDESDGQARVAKTATLEITPKQAEILAVVTEVGSISLSLRSLARDQAELERLARQDEPLRETVPTKGMTFTMDSEASRLVNGTGRIVNVARGNKTEDRRF